MKTQAQIDFTKFTYEDCIIYTSELLNEDVSGQSCERIRDMMKQQGYADEGERLYRQMNSFSAMVSRGRYPSPFSLRRAVMKVYCNKYKDKPLPLRCRKTKEIVLLESDNSDKPFWIAAMTPAMVRKILPSEVDIPPYCKPMISVSDLGFILVSNGHKWIESLDNNIQFEIL